MANETRRGDELAERFVGFAVAALDLAERLPKDYASQHVMRQLARSATAPGALYEEARPAQAGPFSHSRTLEFSHSRIPKS